MFETPNVFLSWSGPRSKAMASALNEWLPDVIQSVVPFFSDEVETGAFWDDSIKTSLKSVRFAVVCCTPENVTAPWLNYEAGALAERMEGGTAPWLLDSKPEALKVSPLSRLMARTTDKTGTFALLQTLNMSLERGSLSLASLTKAFERLWPDLEKKLKAIPAPSTTTPERSDRDMLQEVVGLCRQLSKDGRVLSSPDFARALQLATAGRARTRGVHAKIRGRKVGADSVVLEGYIRDMVYRYADEQKADYDPERMAILCLRDIQKILAARPYFLDENELAHIVYESIEREIEYDRPGPPLQGELSTSRKA